VTSIKENYKVIKVLPEVKKRIDECIRKYAKWGEVIGDFLVKCCDIAELTIRKYGANDIDEALEILKAEVEEE